MTHQEYLQFHKQMTDKMYQIARSKNHDYAGGNNDAMENFKLIESMGIVETETGFLVRMTDKFSRIKNFVKKGVLHVKNESIEDTILDFANYLILFAAYIKEKRSKEY